MKKNKNTSNNINKKTKQSINLNNEIIIGLTPTKEEKKKKQKKEKNTKIAKKNKNINKKNTIKKRKKRVSTYIVKWTSLLILLFIVIILLLRSSIFNIKEINVINNNKVTSEEIIKLSTLKVNNNMFKYNRKTIKNLIKTNAYIEDVKIKRSLNGCITLDILERTPTYMLKFANAYVYINNQGYMLEMTETPLELPTITGFETPVEEIKEGNRLIIKDLEKLEDIIKIMNTAIETDFVKLVTNIDITNKNNYIITLASENKVVQFGGATNISVKILKIKEILEKEKEVEGEIYFQNSEKTIFREKVNF